MDFGFNSKKDKEDGEKSQPSVVSVDIGGSDFWDMGAGDNPGAMGFPAEQKKKKFDFSPLTRILGLGLLLSFVAFAGAVMLDDTLLDTLSLGGESLIGDDASSFENPKVAPIPPVMQSKKQKKLAKSMKKAAPAMRPENPYWDLDNSTRTTDNERKTWTELEEVVWNRDIQSGNPWHRYRVAVEVSKYQLQGSERILWRLLEDSKFWVRMRALAGLGDFGVPLSVSVIHKVVQEARTDLLWRYLKRYIESSTPGERYLMRGLIRLVGGKARLIILRAIANRRDAWTSTYLKAALQDPEPRIAQWAQRQQSRRPWLFKDYRSKDKDIVVKKQKEELNYEKALEGGFDAEAWQEWDALYR